MNKLEIDVSKKYDILIGSGLLGRAGELIFPLSGAKKILIISDQNVAPLYLSPLKDNLKNMGFSDVFESILPAGEETKSLASAEHIYSILGENNFSKTDFLIALGGGVIGDLTGYVAASYLRGMPYIGIPTTLLSQIDSSVGGKTAVNTAYGKNLVGFFHHPSLVICDTQTLSTLPPGVFTDGMGEAVKYGMIWDKGLLHMITDGTDLTDIITRCIDIKREVVEQDERDTGIRQILNFGHTLGHAVEILSGFSISHGSAVAIGMALITDAAVKNGFCEQSVLQTLLSALEKQGLPQSCPYTLAELCEVALRDKKRDGDHINLIIPLDVGRCEILRIPVDKMLSFMEGNYGRA